jgi:hypothetical protein
MNEADQMSDFMESSGLFAAINGKLLQSIFLERSDPLDGAGVGTASGSAPDMNLMPKLCLGNDQISRRIDINDAEIDFGER